MKTLKFRHHLVAEILAGRKTVTWRLFDDKNLQVGDRLDLLIWETKEKFAAAEIVALREKTLGQVSPADYRGHESFAGQEEMLANYRKYYGARVTLQTPVKIIAFKIAAPGEPSGIAGRGPEMI